MNAKNRIEFLVNNSDPALTISNIPKSFPEHTRKSMEQKLAETGMDALDCCCYLTTVISRMEKALTVHVGEPFDTFYEDVSMRDPSVFYGDPAPEDYEWEPLDTETVV